MRDENGVRSARVVHRCAPSRRPLRRHGTYTLLAVGHNKTIHNDTCFWFNNLILYRNIVFTHGGAIRQCTNARSRTISSEPVADQFSGSCSVTVKRPVSEARPGFHFHYRAVRSDQHRRTVHACQQPAGCRSHQYCRFPANAELPSGLPRCNATATPAAHRESWQQTLSALRYRS